MFPSPLPCIDINVHKTVDGLFHHLVAEMTNTRNGRTKMHAKPLCRTNRQPTKLKGCAKHVELRHKKHMEYDGMNGGMVNQDGKHQ